MQVTNFGQRNMVVRAANRGRASSASKGKKAQAKGKAAAANVAQRVADLKSEYTKLKVLVAEASLSSARNRAGFARSSARVTSLDADGSASTIGSTEEVNTTPTSVSNRAPTVQRWTTGGPKTGRGSSKLSIHGDYTGTADVDWKIQLDGSVNLNGNRGKLKFSVYKDRVLESKTILLNRDYATDAKLSVGDGLEISFGAGNLRSGEYWLFQTRASVGTDLDPTKAFNGTGADHPGLSDATPIVDGSVEINGVEVAVYASDSLDSLLTRINQSAAKVEGSFDTATDRLSFTSTVDGARDITFANDSSGVVAALKLDGATTVQGLDADRTRTIAEVDAFSSVSSGTLTINGVDIEVDTATDSLDDLLARINASEAGVKASYHDNTGRLSIVGKSSAEDLVVDSDATGLLETMSVATGTYEAVQRRGISATKAKELTDAMAKVVTELNELMGRLASASNVAGADTARNNISRSMRALTGASGRTQLGLKVDFDSAGKFIDFDEAAQRKFRAALSSNARGVATFLEGKGTKDGFFDIIDKQMHVAETALATEYGTGILVSASA